MGDPTYGRIDPDIQATVDAMNPPGIGARVAWENTLQSRRDFERERDKLRATSQQTGSRFTELARRVAPHRRHARGLPPTIHLIRAYGSGVWPVPNYTTVCTCGMRVEGMDADVHNEFVARHRLWYPSTRRVPLNDDAWFAAARAQGIVV